MLNFHDFHSKLPDFTNLKFLQELEFTTRVYDIGVVLKEISTVVKDLKLKKLIINNINLYNESILTELLNEAGKLEIPEVILNIKDDLARSKLLLEMPAYLVEKCSDKSLTTTLKYYNNMFHGGLNID